ncbi:heavy metal translocating P-type ATPase [Rarobacter faecitabidus]
MTHESMGHMHHGDGQHGADHDVIGRDGAANDRADPGEAGHADRGHGSMGHDAMDHAAMGHGSMGNGHMAHHAGMFRRLFILMSIVAVPVVVLSPMFAELLGYDLPDSGPFLWVSPVLGTVMYLWGGRPFLTGAVTEIRSRKPGMMLLIATAITVAFGSSLGASLHLLDHGLDFWWELALLIVIMLAGHWLEMRSLAQTSGALDALEALLPDRAERVTESGSEYVPPGELEVGDEVIVRPGGRIPADGEVTDGAAAVDEAMVTGESVPVRRERGSRVVAGTIATDSGLRIKVTATGDDTALAGIGRLVAQAQESSSRAQRLADRAAGWLFWFALAAAAITAIIWTAVHQPDEAVVRAITVLVIACPHALGLAIPLVVSIATQKAARSGILVADRLALERMRLVDAVVFDKTGTLTRGEPEVVGISAARDWDEARLLTVAAAAEAPSEHPLARALVRAARDRGLELPPATEFNSSPAHGVTAIVAGSRIAVGGPAMLADAGLQRLQAAHQWDEGGATILSVIAGGEVIGAIALADAIRDESIAAVRELHARGLEVIMMTGDAETVARSVAERLGIDRWYAQVKPEDKARRVAKLVHEGRVVAMVGDGVNDAPALAAASVGIAIGAGTDVAIASAGLILASDDPRSVLSLIDLSRATYRKMRQNLGWAAGYNLVSVPLAAGVLAPLGFVLPMSVGAILMSASTIVVAVNAQLLRRQEFRQSNSNPQPHPSGEHHQGTSSHDH